MVPTFHRLKIVWSGRRRRRRVNMSTLRNAYPNHKPDSWSQDADRRLWRQDQHCCCFHQKRVWICWMPDILNLDFFNIHIERWNPTRVILANPDQSTKLLSNQTLPLLKEHIKLGQAGIGDHSVYKDQIKQNKGMDRNKTYNKNKWYKCIMANTNAIWQQGEPTNSSQNSSTRAIQSYVNELATRHQKACWWAHWIFTSSWINYCLNQAHNS